MRDCSEVELRETRLIRATSPLLIVGASVRAAAHAARRSGWRQLILIDQYQDRDLPPGCRGARVRSLDLQPSHLPGIDQARAWLYTGALENRPEVVSRISRRVPLLGNSSAVLHRARDPSVFADVLKAAGLPHAAVLLRPDPRLLEGAWLCKPRKSAAGRGIRWVDDPRNEVADGAAFYQRHISGVSCSGVFLAAGGTARLLGVTQQLIGDRRFGADGFQYAGSIGPLPLTTGQIEQWQKAGHVLSAALGLQGLFGVDAVDSGEAVVPVEINPRFTASVEVIERSWQWPILAWNALACCDGWLPPMTAKESRPLCGKAIVFPHEACEWTARCDALTDEFSEPDGWPAIADIPWIGTQVPPGAPLVTVLARGRSPQEVAERLAERGGRILCVAGRC